MFLPSVESNRKQLARTHLRNQHPHPRSHSIPSSLPLLLFAVLHAALNQRINPTASHLAPEFTPKSRHSKEAFLVIITIGQSTMRVI
jgi:hypothetical protein